MSRPAPYALLVYPRVGGETIEGVAQGGIDPGLSPRGRGNHLRPVAVSNPPLLPVYPRVGGETKVTT